MPNSLFVRFRQLHRSCGTGSGGGGGHGPSTTLLLDNHAEKFEANPPECCVEVAEWTTGEVGSNPRSDKQHKNLGRFVRSFYAASARIMPSVTPRLFPPLQ